jgi:hypothetical protein
MVTIQTKTGHLLVAVFFMFCMICGATVGKIAWHIADRHARDRKAMYEDVSLMDDATKRLEKRR